MKVNRQNYSSSVVQVSLYKTLKIIIPKSIFHLKFNNSNKYARRYSSVGRACDL